MEFHNGTIWSTQAVAVEPEVTLARWRVLEIRTASGNVERHMVGYSVFGYEGRVSSAIQSFDPVTGTVITRSGRAYRLCGPPGVDQDGEYVWRYWSACKGHTCERDVSEEYCGQFPQESARSPEETA